MVKLGTITGKVALKAAAGPELSAKFSDGTIPIVFGIDASYVKPGFAVLDTKGKVLEWRRPDHTKLVTSDRVKSIYNITRDLCLAHKPDIIIIETVAGISFRGDGWRASDALSFARGIIQSAIYTTPQKATLKVYELSPSQIRRELLGWKRGSPDKADIIKYLEAKGYDLPKTPRGIVIDDVADAIALALYVQTLYAQANI